MILYHLKNDCYSKLWEINNALHAFRILIHWIPIVLIPKKLFSKIGC